MVRSLLFFFLSLYVTLCVGQTPAFDIIPLPNSIQLENGKFTFGNRINIVPGSAEVQHEVLLLKTFFASHGIRTTVNPPLEGHNFIFKKNEQLTEEAYLFKVEENGLTIEYKTSKGAFYALQTFFQMVPPVDENWQGQSIQTCTISDQPRFPYRGMHLDVCRHFFPPEFIKEYLDLLATYKFNNFHWHLTEDQGWRIEIKKYPKLQEIAAYRKETLVGHYNDVPQKFDGQEYGGYYTQEEVKEIVAYAAKKHINIIPEIEMPGHAQAAVSAYPELSCTGGPHEVATKWGVFEEVYCSKPETFEFLENVLIEVMELFPSKYIHIGGDECPKTRWKDCTRCQQNIKDLGLADEHELQSYFIQKIEKFLNKNGRQIIGWDEILEGGLAPNATVMSWRGTDGGIAAAKENHDVIMTPTSHCYFDYYQSNSANEPLAIGGYLPLQKVYAYEPVPEELSADQAKHILGAQGNVWTEYMPNEAQVEYMVLPRMQAMAEIGWTNKEHKDFNSFIGRLQSHFVRWKKEGYNFADKTLDVQVSFKATENGIRIIPSTLLPDAKIVYTFSDSKNPETYTGEDGIVIKESNILTLRAENTVGTAGPRKVLDMKFHKGVGLNIQSATEPSGAYQGDGIISLLNGISGSDEKYGDNEWLGFYGKDMEVSLQMANGKKVNSLETRFFNGPGQWIHLPLKVEIYTSSKGENFKLIATKDIEPHPGKVFDFKMEFPEVKDGFLKIRVQRFGEIPDGHAGAGNEAWLFVDEIRLN